MKENALYGAVQGWSQYETFESDYKWLMEQDGTSNIKRLLWSCLELQVDSIPYERAVRQFLNFFYMNENDIEWWIDNTRS